jgi:hypothetical protein
MQIIKEISIKDIPFKSFRIFYFFELEGVLFGENELTFEM